MASILFITAIESCTSYRCDEKAFTLVDDGYPRTDPANVAALPDKPTEHDCAKLSACPGCKLDIVATRIPTPADAGPPSECPATLPATDSPCPFATKCTYSTGDESCTAICDSADGGPLRWRQMCSSRAEIGPPPSCPTTPPAPEDPCTVQGVCTWPATGRCIEVRARCKGPQFGPGWFVECVSGPNRSWAVFCQRRMPACLPSE